MTGIKLNSDLIGLMNFFESMSGAKVKDCIMDEKVLFIIEDGYMGRAIGRSGANIKKLEGKLKKKIRLVEYSSDLKQFVKNLVYPINVANVEEQEGVITISANDSNSRAMIIGRERKNLSSLKEILNRYFKVNDIKVA